MDDQTQDIETSQEEVTDKQRNISGLRPFQKGVSGNPAGRPKGKTIKELVREHLEDNPEDMAEFVSHFIKKNRELAWQMLEGKPQQDIVSDGKQLPTPIYIPGDHSPKEDSESQ